MQKTLLELAIGNEQTEYAQVVVFPILRKRDEYARKAIEQARTAPGHTQADYMLALRKAHESQSTAWRNWMCEEHSGLALELGYSGEPPF